MRKLPERLGENPFESMFPEWHADCCGAWASTMTAPTGSLQPMAVVAWEMREASARGSLV